MALLKYFSVGLSLSVIPSCLASNHIRSTNHFRHRRQSVPTNLPGTWTSQGCYTENPGPRTLSSSATNSANNMTVENCIAFCDSGHFLYAGVEYSAECYCGNIIGNNGANVALTQCNMPCTGNSLESCGGPGRLNVFWNGQQPPPPPSNPSIGSWDSLGCYSDNVNGRALTTGMGVSGPSTNEKCTAACLNAGYRLAGTEYGGECYCGNAVTNGGAHVTDGCTMTCAGNSSQFCGGPNRLNVYNYTGTDLPPPDGGNGGNNGGGGGGQPSNPAIGNWASLGCYSDNVNGRALPNGVGLSGPATNELCTSACFSAGYRYAGTEYAGECYCGSAVTNGGVPVNDGCTMACNGNSTQFCGGPNRLNVYNYTGTDLPPPNGGGGGGNGGNNGGGGGGGGSVVPVTSGLPGTWHYAACYIDNAHGGRISEVVIPASDTNTVESCIATCNSQNYTVAGMEYGVECYCGNRLINGAEIGTEASCGMGCAGNATEACGGPNRLSVYTSGTNITALPVPAPQTTGLPDQWSYAGCYTDGQDLRVLPWQSIFTNNNTAQGCVTRCAEFGYTAAGTEYGEECYCGDVADITAHNGVKVDEAQCGTTCSGDPTQICGGGLKLSMYTFNGTVNVWHKPANTGRYEFFVPGVVVPLIATVGINNKVTFLEKGGTGFPNSTGAYELDISLANDFSKAWREMHIKTDVFCAGSIILPDKGGRQINVGGWSLDSTFGIRFYTPDGAPGVNSTNDWEENFHELSLQRGRWYPTVALLANGSILVVGGETGSNANPQPNLEILPRPVGGDTVIELDWLARTDPLNLYPFIAILPSGKVFIAYYNEARILDPVTFQTVKELPNMPAAVNNFLGGRTYPLEGAFALFPQHAPYTDPLRVLVCGGSTPGPASVLDNCVSIEPETDNAKWTLERMPSRRVMPCMATLPDGTFLIANGAFKGVAGFGLAEDPNLTAWIYDPAQPVGQRFSILNSTIVARMYHSEITLLPDGRVLISGSDPQTPDLPEEFRIEVYVPPYLTQGFRQPEYTLGEKDWTYGSSHTITNVHLYQGSSANIRVSLIAATSSTHGNTMGSRTIFPEFSCNGNSCTIVAPPNANVSPPGWHMLFILDGPTPSHGQWVRIGGDPAQLGNWPQLEDFTPPGMGPV